MKTTELNVNEKIINALKKMNFDNLMPIQEKAIPVILKGNNVIGQADTGTGKTAAFLIPILNKINCENNDLEVLIASPTRELAMQIVSEINKIGMFLNIKVATLVGGMSIQAQNKELKNKPKIVVGTLGRINDHIRAKRLDLSKINTFVLDEADEMLKEGFMEDIMIINNLIPQNKQVLLFSATMSKDILNITKKIMDNYEMISVIDENQQSASIEQYYMILKEKNKFPTLIKLLDIEKPKRAIIFGRTKRRADELNEALIKCGYKSMCIHGDLLQNQRNSVMNKFRNNEINILVATDVAARGIDVSGISHVYNFDLPQEVEFYIHRIGRTGRGFDSGISYSFIKDSELPHIKRIEKEHNVIIKEKAVPSFNELTEERNKDVQEILKEKIKEIDTTRYEDFAQDLIEEFGASKLVACLIEILGKKDISGISLTGEPPVKIKSSSKKSRGSSHNRKYSQNKKNDDFKSKDRSFYRRGKRNK